MPPESDVTLKVLPGDSLIKSLNRANSYNVGTTQSTPDRFDIKDALSFSCSREYVGSNSLLSWSSAVSQSMH